MLNEEKIKLMIDLSFLEKKEGRSIRTGNTYFKGDYIAKHLLQSFFAYTFCFFLVLALVLLYGIEDLVSLVDLSAIIAIFKNYLLVYAGGLVLYLGITWIICSVKYDKMREVRRHYLARIRVLEKRYAFRSRARELMKEEMGDHA